MADLYEKGVVDTGSNVNTKRSTFDLSHNYKTGCKSGQLIPFFMEEVLPGDTFSVGTSFVTRMLTPAVPVMDNAYLDYFFFFVPSRIACNKEGIDDKSFQKVMGENTSTAWAAQNLPEMPSVNLHEVFLAVNNWCLHNVNSYSSMTNVQKYQEILKKFSCTLWCYFALPPVPSLWIIPGYPYMTEAQMKAVKVSLAPFYAYQTIWNRRFRNQNITNPRYKSGAELCISEPYELAKLHDVMTDALPAPQKGDAVILNFLSGLAPVVPNGVAVDRGEDFLFQLAPSTGSTASGSFSVGSANVGPDQAALFTVDASSHNIQGSNLYADLGSTEDANVIDVNSLRFSLSLQSLYELEARTGTRYKEQLMAQFNVDARDLPLDDPEYLGGKHVPINIDTVLATTGTASQALGDTGAFSNTFDSDGTFKKSFTQHGYLIGCFGIRTHNSYFQGINKKWRHLSKLDFFNRMFAHIGEQPIKTSELFIGGDSDEHVFGYQEAWYEYRAHEDQITGALNPVYGDEQLKKWTFANEFASAPTLSDSFMFQSSVNIGDTLVDTEADTQFICDFYFAEFAARELPLMSVPSSLIGRY